MIALDRSQSASPPQPDFVDTIPYDTTIALPYTIRWISSLSPDLKELGDGSILKKLLDKLHSMGSTILSPLNLIHCTIAEQRDWSKAYQSIHPVAYTFFSLIKRNDPLRKVAVDHLIQKCQSDLRTAYVYNKQFSEVAIWLDAAELLNPNPSLLKQLNLENGTALQLSLYCNAEKIIALICNTFPQTVSRESVQQRLSPILSRSAFACLMRLFLSRLPENEQFQDLCLTNLVWSYLSSRNLNCYLAFLEIANSSFGKVSAADLERANSYLRAMEDQKLSPEQRLDLVKKMMVIVYDTAVKGLEPSDKCLFHPHQLFSWIKAAFSFYEGLYDGVSEQIRNTFARFFRVFLERKFLGHLCEMNSGELIRYEGADGNEEDYFQSRTMKLLKNSSIDLNLSRSEARTLIKALEIVPDNSSIQFRVCALNRIRRGELVLIRSGWKQHAFYLVFHGRHLVVVDGAKEQPYHCYPIDPKQMNAKLFEECTQKWLSLEGADAYGRLRNFILHLRDDKAVADPRLTRLLSKLQPPIQQVGNCAWYSLQEAIRVSIGLLRYGAAHVGEKMVNSSLLSAKRFTWFVLAKELEKHLVGYPEDPVGFRKDQRLLDRAADMLEKDYRELILLQPERDKSLDSLRETINQLLVASGNS